MKLYLDTDAGVDDALALLFALGAPGVELVGIGTVDGNVERSQVVANVLELLTVSQREELPVFPGARDPLVPEPRERATFFHGTDGLGELPRRRARGKPRATPAALALTELARNHPGELVVVALGPLTNLALALRLDPELPDRVRALFVMGGAHTARGNSRSLAAEFNFRADPEAARAVLAAFPHTVLIPWETALRHSLPWDRHRRLAAAHPFYRAITGLTATRLERRGYAGLLIPDVLAVAAAILPESIVERQRIFASVELCGEHARGMLIAAPPGRGRKANAELVLGLDEGTLFSALEHAIEHALGGQP